MPPRIVHLLGGLRAVDDRQGKVFVQAGRDCKFCEFPVPNYAKLYAALRALKLETVGAEFVNDHSYQGLDTPDWQCAAPSGQFSMRLERHAWADVRHAAIQDRNPEIADGAARAKTYVDLLAVRIFQLSGEYNGCLRAWHLGAGDPNGTFFENGFVRNIDAAIHAFAADAASLRDLIAELVWRDVQGEVEEVRTLGTFLKRNRDNQDPLVSEIVAEGQNGGWIKQLTDLRNHITHVAPVGRGHALHFCEARKRNIGDIPDIPTLHYPLLGDDGSILEILDSSIDYDDAGAFKAAIREYQNIVSQSIDALQYAWETVARLVDLLGDVRQRAGYRTETPHLTEDDIVNVEQL